MNAAVEAVRYLKLALSFDTAPLQAELGRILATEWVDHYNTTAYASGWQCIPLRSVGGRLDHIVALDSDAYADTVILERCPQLQQVLATFECELQSVRLMALGPGASILPHRDPGTGYEDGVARLHIPVCTEPEVLFHIEGEAVHFSQGGTWYLNANCTHAVENRSAANRVHLALDCVPNAWLDALFAQAGYQARKPAHGLAAQERALMQGEEVAEASLASLRGWYPVTASASPARIGWRHMGEQRFTEPFFSDSLAARQGQPRRTCRTPYAALAQFEDVIAPSAFIFHVSRCGSTLLTQSLAALAHCVVMSEPPVLDAFLREHGPGPLCDEAVNVFRQLVGALGQRRHAGERALVIKLDCWHIHSLASVRRAFPDTPCIFLYREPDAVLASHRRRRGPQMVPGMIDPVRLGIAASALAPGDLDGYCIAVLEGLYASALAQAEEHDLILLNYHQLPGAIAPWLLERVSIGCSEDDAAAIGQRARFHSKDGGAPFGGDPHGEAMHAGARLAALYQHLEQLRTA